MTAEAVPNVPPSTVMLNDAVSPPMIVASVAVFTTDASGQLTVTLTVAVAVMVLEMEAMVNSVSVLIC